MEYYREVGDGWSITGRWVMGVGITERDVSIRTNAGHQGLLHCLLSKQFQRAGGRHLPTSPLHQHFVLLGGAVVPDVTGVGVMVTERGGCGRVSLRGLPRSKWGRKGHLANLR